MHLRVTETAEASLAEAVAEASNKATVVVLRYMAWQRYHFHWAEHNGSGEFIVGLSNRATMDLDTTLRNLPLTPEIIEKAVSEICAVDAGDGILF